MRPASGRISPARHWRVTVLPAPEGPKSPTTDFSAVQRTSSVNPGYRLTISTETTPSVPFGKSCRRLPRSRRAAGRRARAAGVDGTRSRPRATDPAAPGGAQPQRGSARVPRGPAIPAARARRLRRRALSSAYHDFEDGTLARGPPQDLGRDPAADQPPVERVADEAAMLDDDAAAEDRGHGPALDRPALPGAVVAHVKILARERLSNRRIDEDEVRVAPGRDDALLRIEPENPRRVRGRHVGEPLERHPALHDAFGEDDPHARFRAEVAAGHVLEVLAAKLQLERGRELVGRRRRDAVVHESVPERRLVLGVLEGGIGVVTKAPRRLVVLGGEAGVVVERLGVDREPLRARLGDRLHALPGRGVHEVDARAGMGGELDRPPEREQLRQLVVDEREQPAVGLLLLAELLVHELHE